MHSGLDFNFEQMANGILDVTVEVQLLCTPGQETAIKLMAMEDVRIQGRWLLQNVTLPKQEPEYGPVRIRPSHRDVTVTLVRVAAK